MRPYPIRCVSIVIPVYNEQDSLPDSEWNSQRICSIPLFPDLGLEGVERVAAAIEAVLGEHT